VDQHYALAAKQDRRLGSDYAEWRRDHAAKQPLSGVLKNGVATVTSPYQLQIMV
jgi:hypothetical protein